jgi:hypothetical protein
LDEGYDAVGQGEQEGLCRGCWGGGRRGGRGDAALDWGLERERAEDVDGYQVEVESAMEAVSKR